MIQRPLLLAALCLTALSAGTVLLVSAAEPPVEKKQPETRQANPPAEGEKPGTPPSGSPPASKPKYDATQEMERLGMKQVQEELDHYKKKVETSPDSARAHYELASAYFRNAIYYWAEKEYARTVELDSTDVEAWFYLGMARAYMGMDTGAIEAYEQSVGQRQQDKRVRWIRCMALSQLSRIPEAVACMEEDLKDDPDNCTKLNVMAKLHSVRKTDAALALAEASLKKAAQVCPKSFQAWDELGKFYFYRGRYQDAVHAYCNAFPFQPDPRYRLQQLDFFRDVSRQVAIEVPCLLPGEEAGFTPKNLLRKSGGTGPVPLER